MRADVSNHDAPVQAKRDEANRDQANRDQAIEDLPAAVLADADRRIAAAMAPFTPGARIVVAMSGGVDSSVTAALLKRAGFDVVGVTMQLYDHGQALSKPGACCAGVDIRDARKVAHDLGMPHYVLDYERRFRDRVIDPFIASYEQGETPIPCVSCNSDLKFGDLLDMATSLGAEALTTGHYVQRAESPTGPILVRGRDQARDQSYFLFSTTKAQLRNLAFPLGGFEKPEIRAIAKALGIVVAAKPDSQDICFVPKGGYAETIERLKPGAGEPGDIKHVDGSILGRHAGIIHFTVGQRKGLGVATGEPLFVIRLDSKRREVIVGPKKRLGVNRIRLRGVNWLGDGESPPLSMPLHVRLRSSQGLKHAVLQSDPHGSTSIYLHEPEFGISTGQACVFYDTDSDEGRVLGGGWISATEFEEHAS